MDNSTSSAGKNQTSFSSPVSVLPLFTLLTVTVAVLIVACVIYRKRKQVRLVKQLRMTEKRIDVLAEDLEKARDKGKV